MTLEKRKAIASLGGISAHRAGHAHVFTSEEAQRAGRIGGQRSQQSRRGKSKKKAGS